MKMSCNGCRVLRKGCSDHCIIRPCLQWIKNPESQSNATVFLAKFYGRAGLVNLINAGPDHLRPAIFRSLLYEACGRIVNPIYGSVGLLWSGSWQLCQEAVEAVLKGAPIVQMSSEMATAAATPPLKACDIRHNSKDSAARPKLNKTKFKRSGTKKAIPNLCDAFDFESSCSHESAVLSADDAVEAASPGTDSGSEVELELSLGLGRTAERRGCV